MKSEPLSIEDRHAVARNVAANGRLFCSMIFAACMVAFWFGYGAFYARLGVLAALPVGLACIVDQLPAGRVRVVCSVAVYALAGLVAFSFIANIG